MSITLIDETYPFILQGFPVGPKTEPALRALFRHMSEIGERAVRGGTLHVVVAVGDEHFTAAERKLIADCMAQASREEAERVVGAFAVIESGFARGVLTALRWLAPRVIPVVAAATTDEAIDLAKACLQNAGVEVQAEVVALARIHARKLHDAVRGGPPSQRPGRS
jgi:hypothetical protein